jgi:hypothetical protein
LTELSLSAFPFKEPARMRHLLGISSHIDPQPPVPSLVDLCIHRLVTSPTPSSSQQPPRPPFPDPIKDRLAANLVPFYHPSTYNSHVLSARPSRRRSTQVGASERESICIGQKLLLTRCTLLVAPYLLIHQWERELLVHVEEGRLDVIVVNAQDRMPSAERMAVADVGSAGWQGMPQRGMEADRSTCTPQIVLLSDASEWSFLLSHMNAVEACRVTPSPEPSQE